MLKTGNLQCLVVQITKVLHSLRERICEFNKGLHCRETNTGKKYSSVMIAFLHLFAPSGMLATTEKVAVMSFECEVSNVSSDEVLIASSFKVVQLHHFSSFTSSLSGSARCLIFSRSTRLPFQSTSEFDLTLKKVTIV